VVQSALIAALTAEGDQRLLIRDQAGVYHFNGRFRNANDAAAVLDSLAQEPDYAEWAVAERGFILDLFETTFNHRAFTGRSGTFFAYEGLGSIYWHMVSKLLLAAQESYQQAVDEGAETAVIESLADAYYDIRLGIGFNKSPDIYGAFPTDPYSHTPMGNGARQPGMTGQVKEEILTRWGELGITLKEGMLYFSPTLLRPDEFLQVSGEFKYVNIGGDVETLVLSPDSLAFTFCQVPVIYQRGSEPQILVVYENGHIKELPGRHLDAVTTKQILNRDGGIKSVQVTISSTHQKVE